MNLLAEKEGVRSRPRFNATSRAICIPISIAVPEALFSWDSVLDGFPKEKLDAKGNFHLPDVIPREAVLIHGGSGSTLLVLVQRGMVVDGSHGKNTILFWLPSEGVFCRKYAEGDRRDEISNVFMEEGLNNMGFPENFLFKSEKCPSWSERVGIALDIARGILYLHEECETQIIHCDIKPQNILMDKAFCAKIADFGLAKLLMPDQTRTSTQIRGTRGYTALEWHKSLPVTIKADVYRYGIMLLEIICYRKRLDTNLQEDEIILSDWVYQCFEEGELGKLVDDEEVDAKRFERMVRVALWCIQDDPVLRPQIKKVVLMLEETIEIPVPPGPNFLNSI
ncbi:hypothetical protein GIB67_030659 [Kingdonia uniflora]|uniref:Protein kinase domain-containing protein n=1 Tax=Kingdonia uniflora TaxID=39325 RepID=A0A7J7NIH2_9MAGN|nr:hypothetical protein GIB67_030659 [Kingdonia uniflora]